MAGMSDRLRLISDGIDTGESFADIGSDHGYVPIDQRRRGNCEKIIISDISARALRRAADNCVSCRAEARNGSGLRVLEKAEVDAVVIAGMGGRLIAEILEEDREKTLSFPKFILQPRNNEGYLRYCLSGLGLAIKADRLVREGRHICAVITAAPGEFRRRELPEDDILWSLPAETGDRELYAEYVKRLLSCLEKARQGHLRGGRDTDKLDGEIACLERRLKDAEE